MPDDNAPNDLPAPIGPDVHVSPPATVHVEPSPGTVPSHVEPVKPFQPAHVTDQPFTRPEGQRPEVSHPETHKAETDAEKAAKEVGGAARDAERTRAKEDERAAVLARHSRPIIPAAKTRLEAEIRDNRPQVPLVFDPALLDKPVDVDSSLVQRIDEYLDTFGRKGEHLVNSLLAEAREAIGGPRPAPMVASVEHVVVKSVEPVKTPAPAPAPVRA